MPTANESLVEFSWHPEPLVIARDVLRTEAAFRNTEIPIEAALPVVQKNIRYHFETYGEGAWPFWADSYYPRVIDVNPGILRRPEEDLYNSVLDRGNFLITPATLEWTGEAAPFYWFYHQDGAPNANVPERPFVYIDFNVGEPEVEAVFREWLNAVGDCFMGATAPGLVSGTLRPGVRRISVGGGGTRFFGPTGVGNRQGFISGSNAFL